MSAGENVNNEAIRRAYIMVGTRIPFHKFLSLYRATMPENLIFLA